MSKKEHSKKLERNFCSLKTKLILCKIILVKRSLKLHSKFRTTIFTKLSLPLNGNKLAPLIKVNYDYINCKTILKKMI